MTPKERAQQLVDIRDRAEQLMVSQFGMDIDHPDEFENDIRAIEQAIIAAVEAEREECLKILQKTYQEWVDGDWAPGEAFESARDRIRARGVTNVTY